MDTYEGSINGDTFCDFVQRCLVPILQPFNGTNDRSVVVMDNACLDSSCHYYSTDRCFGKILTIVEPRFKPCRKEVFAKVKSFLKANEVVYDVTS